MRGRWCRSKARARVRRDAGARPGQAGRAGRREPTGATSAAPRGAVESCAARSSSPAGDTEDPTRRRICDPSSDLPSNSPPNLLFAIEFATESPIRHRLAPSKSQATENRSVAGQEPRPLPIPSPARCRDARRHGRPAQRACAGAGPTSREEMAAPAAPAAAPPWMIGDIWGGGRGDWGVNDRGG